jgi:hypothetical protein
MRNQKGFSSLIAILVLGVLVLGGIGYVVLQKKSVPPEINQNNSSINSTSTNTVPKNDSFFVSPKDGDVLTMGNIYTVELSKNVLDNYHVLTHSFILADQSGKVYGSLCPSDIKTGSNKFTWTAGSIWSSCAGTGNSEININPGKYQIIFSLMDSTTASLKEREASGWFSLVSSTSEDGDHMGFIKSTFSQNNKKFLSIDYVEWLNGKDAMRAMLKDGQCKIEGMTLAQALEKLDSMDMSSGAEIFGNCIPPDGYFLSNTNPKLRTFEISPNVQIIVQTWTHGIGGDFNWNQKISLDTFYGIFNGTILKTPEGYSVDNFKKYSPFVISVKNNIVEKIVEQYRP